MDADSKYSPSPSTLETWLDGIVVLLQYDRQKYYTLNATGSFIWKCVLDGKSTSAIEASLCDEFGILPEHAEKTATKFLTQLVDTDLIELRA